MNECLLFNVLLKIISLIQFYLTGHGATTFTQINKERPPQRQGGQTGPLRVFMSKELG